MNKKKLFAALTSAAMLLSQAGSTALAQEMEEVEAGSVGGVDVEKSEIELNDVNFPDDNFRAAVKLAYSKVAGITDVTYAKADEQIKNTTKASVEKLESILTLAPEVADPTKIADEAEARKAADYDSTAETPTAMPFKDLTGIEYLTGLEYLTLLNSPQLKEANLEKNGELVEVVIVPMQEVAASAPEGEEGPQSALVETYEADETNDEEETPPTENEDGEANPLVTPPTFGAVLTPTPIKFLEPTPIEATEEEEPAEPEGPSEEGEEETVAIDQATIQPNDLHTLVLPEETTNLAVLKIAGASQITTLDLSAYDGLETIDLQSNSLADLNVNGCTALTQINVSFNQLTGLDLSNTGRNLKYVIADNNNLYELQLPSSKNLEYLSATDNKLTSVDVSGVTGLKTLDLGDNRLESIDLSSNTALEALNLAYNHLATLDLSENSDLKAAAASDENTGGAETLADDEGGDAEDTKEETTGFTAATWGADGIETPASGVGLTDQYLYANTTDSGIDLKSYDENFQAVSESVGWIKDSVVGGTIGKDGVLTFGNTDDGISYQYSTNETLGADTPLVVNIIQADLMNRLYNPNSGEHFYTKDLHEKDVLVELGWHDEGIGWIAPKENSTTPAALAAGEAVFRLYNPNAGDHHYTADSKEKDALVRLGWNYEGVGWYSAKEDTDQSPVYSIEVYREYNPNAKEAGAHNYTTSENENDTLVALGWLDEGIGWWALK